MSSNRQINEKLDHMKNLLSAKVHKYAYHFKELMLIKSSRLNQNIVHHVPYFYENYIENFYRNPLHFTKFKKEFSDYAVSEGKDVKEELSRRYKLSRERLQKLYESENWVTMQYYVAFYFSFFFLLTSIVKRI